MFSGPWMVLTLVLFSGVVQAVVMPSPIVGDSSLHAYNDVRAWIEASPAGEPGS